jgi:F-type H+-transporting ATPase subunit b
VPQLDATTFVPQLFWLVVTFCILLLLMARIGLPRVGGLLEARRKRIDDDLARATELKAEAEAVLAAYQQTLASARAQAQAAVKEATDKLAAEAAERQRQLGQTLADRVASAEREIAAAKQRALAELHDIAVEVARSVTEKVTGTAADTASLGVAVDRAMAERTS